MRALSGAGLLDAWELGFGMGRVERAQALLDGAGWAPGDPRSLARWHQALLDVRIATAGTKASTVSTCPGCGEAVEADFDLSSIRRAPTTADAIVLRSGGWEVHARLPSVDDLAAAATCRDAADARQLLWERCVEAVMGIEGDRHSVALPADVETAVVQRLADADPVGDVVLMLSCDGCGEAWRAPFDVAAFVWAEAEAWARRLLGEVAELAWAFGWSEAEIVKLSPWRRRAYLEMAGG